MKTIMLILLTALLTVSCANDSKVGERSKIYDKNETEAIRECINVADSKRKILEQRYSELKKKRVVFSENKNIEEINSIAYEYEMPKARKIDSYAAKSFSEGEEPFFMSLGGIGNKNEQLARAMAMGFTFDVDLESMKNHISKDNMNLQLGNTDIEEIIDKKLEFLSNAIIFNSLSAEVMKTALKENKKTIPKLTDKQKELTELTVNMNKYNIDVLEDAIKNLKNEKERIILKNNYEKIYGSIKEKVSIDSRLLKEMINNQKDQSVSEQILMVRDFYGFKLDNNRLAQTIFASFNIAEDISEIEKNKKTELDEDKTIDILFAKRMNLYKDLKKRLEEYNNVLNGALEGKNYIIDNRLFYRDYMEDVFY